MNAKTLFTFVAIIASLFGLGLTFAPAFMGEQYLTNPSWINAGAKLLAQGWGTMLIVYAVACWYVRDAGSSSSCSNVMLLFVVLSNLVLIIIHTMAVLNGVEKAIGWGQALLSLVLLIWSGMLFRQTNRVIA